MQYWSDEIGLTKEYTNALGVTLLNQQQIQENIIIRSIKVFKGNQTVTKNNFLLNGSLSITNTSIIMSIKNNRDSINLCLFITHIPLSFSVEYAANFLLESFNDRLF